MGGLLRASCKFLSPLLGSRKNHYYSSSLYSEMHWSIQGQVAWIYKEENERTHAFLWSKPKHHGIPGADRVCMDSTELAFLSALGSGKEAGI